MALLILMIGVVAWSSAAVAAEVPAVTGRDHYGPFSGEVEVALVTGLGGGTLYVDVTQDFSDDLPASLTAKEPLEYTFDDPGHAWGVVSLNLEGLGGFTDAMSGRLHVAVRDTADRAAEPLWQGTVWGVYARLGDGTGERLVALRTCAADRAADPFRADAPIWDADSETTYYAPEAKTAPVRDGDRLTVVYAPGDTPDTLMGSIVYVDDAGDTVKTVDVPGVPQDGSARTAEIEEGFFAADSAGTRRYWRPLVGSAPSRTVELTRDRPSLVVRCASASVSDVTEEVEVRYVDEEGSLLMRDAVVVSTGGYRYAPPQRFSRTWLADARSGGAVQTAEYELADPSRAQLDLTLADAGTVTLVYRALPASTTYRVRCVNGVTGEVLDTRSLDVAEGEPVHFDVPEQMSAVGADGTEETLVSWRGNGDAVTYSLDDARSGVEPGRTLYYLPRDYVAAAPYDVAVRYVDAATNEVVGGRTERVGPDGSVSVAGPETVEADGVTYERLGGQPSEASHPFFSARREYVVYYGAAAPAAGAAGSEEAASGAPTTTVVRVEVLEGSKTPAGDPGQGTVSGSATRVLPVSGEAPAAAAAGEDAATFSEGDTFSALEAAAADGSAVGDEAVGTLVDGSGTEFAMARIADDAAPLAGPGALLGQGAAPVAVAAAAAALAVLFIVVARRRRPGGREGGVGA